jgi:ABC-type lipoprotein export system ATPase subunit
MNRRHTSPILEAVDVHKSYQLGPTALRVLSGCSLGVDEGEFLAIIGSSGSGKSTLLHLLGALDRPDVGTIRYRGQDIFAMPAAERDALRNGAFGFVFQFYHLLPELDVLENVLLPQLAGAPVGTWFSGRAKALQRARDLLEMLGLSQRLGHRPNQLSGGERQRVAIARALMNEPAVLLADEPTGNLDAATGQEILSVFETLHRAGQTIVLVTHEHYVAKRAQRVVRLQEGALQKAALEESSAEGRV